MLRLLAAACALPCSSRHVVRSDQHWVDTDGNRIEAHAAGMLQSPVDNRWYWYGESKKTDTLADHGVNCYSAATIAGPWTFEGKVLTQNQIKEPPIEGPFIVERPKVLYNAKTKKFVMWFHLDGPFPEQPGAANAAYSFRHAGIAQSDSPVGPFEYVHGILPDGMGSLDMSLFQDPLDGQAYLIRSVENHYAGWSRLTEDYLNTTGIISNHSKFEGMAMFRLLNGTYYIVSSHLTGWNPNPLTLFMAEGATLDDPQWVSLGNPTHHDTSFNSQPTYVVQYTPSSGEPYFVYMADDWIHCPNDDGTEGPLINACYIWLPIQFTERGVRINWCAEWDLDDPFAPCSSPVPAPGPAPTPGCEAEYSPVDGDTVALVECITGIGAGHKWTFDGTFRELSWAAISDTAACASNSDGVMPTDSLGMGHTLESCQAACAQKSSCVAIDYLEAKSACNLYDVACQHPLQTKHNASSYRVTSSAPGLPGALKVGKKCLAPGIADGSLQLVDCTRAKAEQFQADGRRFRRASDGACLDVHWCGDIPCAGMELQTFECNEKHPNQEFALDIRSGFLTSNVSGAPLCATACASPQALSV